VIHHEEGGLRKTSKTMLLYATRLTPMLLAGLLWAGGAIARNLEPLPQPLGLEQALELATGDHPEILKARSRLEQADAQRGLAEADSGIMASLRARLRWVDPPSIATDREHDDHFAGLSVRKRLYDFGRTRASVSAAEAEWQGGRWSLADAQARQRLEVMSSFFAVLLADLDYTRDNEDMSVLYIRYDQTRDRHELGQVSDVDLLRAESAYQAILVRRTASDLARRTARARLANALNRPGDLPADLLDPDLPERGPLPPVEQLTEEALAGNPALLALQARVTAAQERLRAAEAERLPILSAEAETGVYSRKFSSRDHWRAGLVLEMPLATGGRTRSRIARQRAELAELQAELTAARMELRQQVLEQWSRVQELTAQRHESEVLADYRDLYMDRSRALYEMEVKTDLGDAAVRSTEARIEAARARYGLALAWARLDALRGRPVLPFSPQPEKLTQSEETR
jgi:outer membrane protein TolC